MLRTKSGQRLEAGLAVAFLLALASCGFEPSNAELAWKLSKASEKSLADAPKERETLARELTRLFGTPAAPQYGLPVAENGRGELGSARWDELVQDNRRRFADPLAALERGEFDADLRFDSAPELTRSWRALAALPPVERSAKARALLVDSYPALGDSSELYRQQCLYCHGVEGGGDGPTAATLDPRPRDFRKGIFKFTAVKQKARPRREDLVHILDVGVYGTAMTTFRRLSEAEREGLADYVRLLAIRGEVEGLLLAAHAEGDELYDAQADSSFAAIWGKWRKAREQFIAFDGVVSADTPAMRTRGKELYLDTKKGNCVSCHGAEGLGDGILVWKIDAQGRRVPAYQDDWGFDIKPANLRTGIFRGGYRPIDIYRRIYAGINGGPMPGVGESKDAEGKPLLSAEDMWALVHYVRSLSERASDPSSGAGGAH